MGSNNEKSAAILGAIAAGVAESGGGGGGGGVAGVSTFKGRSGNVYPQNNDYTASQVATSEAGKNVQQKLDELATGAIIDDALSPTSQRAVQNRVIAQGINEVDAKTLPAGGGTGDVLAKTNGSDYQTEWVPSNNFMFKSTYDTNNNGKVDKADVAWAMQASGTYVARLKTISADTYVLTDLDRGVPNGLCPLDTNSKIPLTHLPDAITSGMTYGGIFNPQTRLVRLTPQAKEILGVTADTMTLVDSPDVPAGYPANVGLFYITTASGTFASMNFTEGDWLMSLGTQWTQVSLAVRVSSVNSKTGAVSLDSDDIPEGATNLYLTSALKTKLEGIENEATKDTNVIQTAQIITDPDTGEQTLRLTNKNGSVVNFVGGGGDMADYLKKDGNASDVFVRYTSGGSRQAFVGNERMSVIMAKIVTWLEALEDVAFTGAYNDISGRPTKVSQFTNDSGYVTRTVNNLSNYYTTAQTYTRDEIEALIDAVGSFNFIEVPSLPTTGIDDHAIYYVPRTGGGYDRYQHMNGQWLYLGSTDVSMDGYVTTNGSSSNTTVTFTTAAERISIATGETLSVIMGKLAKYIADMKTICFTASWHDLEDSNELATQDDLDEKIDKQQEVAQAGKVLGIGEDGIVAPMTVATGVVRPGTGTNAGIANDTDESPINTATGRRAFAFGDHTKASGNEQVVTGRYNVEDAGSTYAEIVGGGEAGAAKNIRTTDWTGQGWYSNGVKAGGTISNIFTPTDGNDLTTKNYVDNYVDEEIGKANLLKAMIVTEIPDVADADANTLYLLQDPTAEDVYLQYKKVLQSQNPDVYIMAKLGSTQITSSSTQVQVLPAPSAAFDGMTYQYIGSASGHDVGFFYKCTNVGYFAWVSTDDAKYYYTNSANPRQWDKIYDENFAPIAKTVKSATATTLTDSANKTYTRLAAQDSTKWEWVELNHKLSQYVNDGTGTGSPEDYFVTRQDALTAGSAITTVTDTTTVSKVVPETGTVADVTAKKLFEYIAKKIYPVGSIYTTITSDNPGTLFGGTWELVGADRVLWGVNASTGAGGTLDEQLPDIRGHIDWATGGQAKTEISSGTGAFSLTNKNLGAAYPTGSGASNSARGFDFRASYYSSAYKLNASVRPAAYTVHFWRRTA